jgi:hypothetical protein
MNKFLQSLTVGTDPELFIMDRSTGKVISAIGLIPGEKGEPYKPKDLPDGFGVQTDNILAEFNIPPVKSREEFIANINVMKNFIRQFVQKINENYDILCQASARVDEDQLQSDQAKLFGCDPDYNAYTESQNPKPKGDITNLRSTGMHVHLGFAENVSIPCKLNIIRMLDFTLGIPSIIIDRDKDRRTLYGKAGCFRLTSYGVEYRTVSGAMLKTDARIGLVYDLAVHAVRTFSEEKYQKLFYEASEAFNIEKVINTANIGDAKSIVKRYLPTFEEEILLCADSMAV